MIKKNSLFCNEYFQLNRVNLKRLRSHIKCKKNPEEVIYQYLRYH